MKDPHLPSLQVGGKSLAGNPAAAKRKTGSGKVEEGAAKWPKQGGHKLGTA